MKTYALFGIDKYHHARLLCLVSASSLAEAAGKLRCGIAEAGKTADRNYALVFEPRQECAKLVLSDPDAFHLALAEGCNPDAPSDFIAKAAASNAYGTDHVFREYLIGTSPIVR